jgi:hypothetical protein
VKLATIAALLLVAGRATAQPGDPRAGGFVNKDLARLEIDDCPAIPDEPREVLVTRAKEHYTHGEVLYQQGDYKHAVTELVDAYCLFPTYYSLLKDIGQAYERSLDYERATAYFERYVLLIPKDAKRADMCAPDPQGDRISMAKRIDVLRELPARILVQTSPDGAHITLVDDAGKVTGQGKSGDELDVRGGRYAMTIEREGFKPIHRSITAEIGKPYTFFETLLPLVGRLRVRTLPTNARIYIDKRQVATGIYESEMPGGQYVIGAEAEDYDGPAKLTTVLPDRDNEVFIELYQKPQFGRRQLIVYATVAGATAAGLLLSSANTTNNSTAASLGAYGALGGATAGFFGTYFGLRDVPLGTSDLTITSSLIGGVVGVSTGAMINGSRGVISSLSGAGLVAGGVVGYVLGNGLHVRPGEAAVVNSGALWGTVAGALFVEGFQPGLRVGGALVVSGLGMGTTAGVLLSRYYTVSRGHAALIDVSGLIGMIGGVALENLFYHQIQNSVLPQQTQVEHTANFALGGLVVGLVTGAILTRSVDSAAAGIVPATSTTQDGKTLTYGARWAF